MGTSCNLRTYGKGLWCEGEALLIADRASKDVDGFREVFVAYVVGLLLVGSIEVSLCVGSRANVFLKRPAGAASGLRNAVIPLCITFLILLL